MCGIADHLPNSVSLTSYLLFLKTISCSKGITLSLTVKQRIGQRINFVDKMDQFNIEW